MQSPAIRLRFITELPLQFTDSKSASIHSREQFWFAFGSVDYLECTALSSLDQIHNEQRENDGGTPLKDDASLASNSNLILVPSVFKLVTHSPRQPDDWKQLAVSHEQKVAATWDILGGEKYQFSAIIRLTLSSIILDHAKTIPNILARLTGAEERISTRLGEVDFKNATVWATMGGPELVVILPLPSDEDFSRVFEFVKWLRELHGPDIGETECVENHAFASVQANFFYRTAAALLSSKTDKPTEGEPKKPRHKYLCRVTVGAGHEVEFVKRALGTTPRSGTYFTVSYRSIVIELSSIDEVIKVIRDGGYKKRTLDEKEFYERRPYFIGIRTSILFEWDEAVAEELKFQDKIPGLNFSPELETLLEEFSQSIRHFSKFLHTSQAEELLHIHRTIVSACRRNDRAIAIRDLFPFIKQLGVCLNSHHWDIYLSKPETKYEVVILEDLALLIRHLWKAIRTRIDQRIQPIDPTFSSSLELGASKLLNASTVAAWIGWEMLRDQGVPGAVCGSQLFGACVATGNRGRVFGTTVFPEFLMDAKKSSNHDANALHAPLVLIEVSGNALFKTHLAVAHFLHEIAEFCEWENQPSATPARECINQWVNEVALECILQETLTGEGDLDTERSDAVWTIRYLISQGARTSPEIGAKLQADKQLGSGEAIEEVFGVIQRDCSPAILFSKLLTWFDIGAKADKNLRDRYFVEHKQTPEKKESTFPTIVSAVQRFDLHEDVLDRPAPAAQLKEIEKVIKDVVADTGAFYALNRILGDEEDVKKKQSRVAMMFGSMLTSLLDLFPSANPERLEAAVSMVIRWAIQHFAVSNGSMNEPEWKHLEKLVGSVLYASGFAHSETLWSKVRPFATFVSKWQHPTVVDEVGQPIGGELVSSPLSGVFKSLPIRLRDLSPYGRNGRPMKQDSQAENDPNIKLLCDAIRKTWGVAAEAFELQVANKEHDKSEFERQLFFERLVLAYCLWAKSQIFCVTQMMAN